LEPAENPPNKSESRGDAPAAISVDALLEEVQKSTESALSDLDPKKQDLTLLTTKLEALLKIRTQILEARNANLAASAQHVSQWKASTWFSLGMLLFGLSVGCITGLSTVQGISQVLLTGVSSFVGAVLLTYAGFKRASRKEGELDFDLGKVGPAVFCFSIGVLLGAVGAAVFRHQIERTEAALDAQTERSQAIDELMLERRLRRLDVEWQRRMDREDQDWQMSHVDPRSAPPAPKMQQNQSPPITMPVSLPPRVHPASPILAFGLENNVGSPICKEYRKHKDKGVYRENRDLAATDAFELYLRFCRGSARMVCQNLSVEMTQLSYRGTNAIEAVTSLGDAFCSK
jgi:hypothetical protein